MYEELKKWKKLLVEGVITQEEFDEKKKAILGLESDDQTENVSETVVSEVSPNDAASPVEPTQSAFVVNEMGATVKAEPKKQMKKKGGNIKFALKWIAIYIGVFAAVLVFGALLECTVLESSRAFDYYFEKLLEFAVVFFVPYLVGLIALTVRGMERRAALKDKIKRLSKDKPVPFRCGAIAVVVVLCLLLALFFSCPHKNLSDATCTEPSHCYDCGKEFGEPLGHDADGDMTLDYVDADSATAHYSVYCSRCGEEVDSETRSVESFVDDGEFTITLSEFSDRLGEVLDENDSWLNLNAQTIMGKLSKYPACSVAKNGSRRQLAGIVFFRDGDKAQTDKDSLDNKDMMITKVSGTSSADFVSINVAAIMAMNPGLDSSECLDIAKQAASRARSGDYYAYKGFKYGLESDAKTFYIVAA